MKKNIYISILLLSMLAFSACDRLDFNGIIGTNGPHHDARFKESMEYNKEYCALMGLEDDCIMHITSDDDYYTLYWCSDVHVAGTTLMLDSFVNMALGHHVVGGEPVDVGPCTAVIIAGDVIDGKGNYPLVASALQPLEDAGVPCFCTPGNHDLCFHQWKEYTQIWPTSSYWFDITTPNGYKDLYICADSGDATFGRKQLNWLKALLQQKSQEGYRHIIVFSHTHMFKRDSNNSHGANFCVEEVYEVTELFRKYHVNYYINGHDHSHEETRYKNVLYYTIGAMKDSRLGFAAYMTMVVYDNYGQDSYPIEITLHRMSGEQYYGWDDWDD